MSYAASGAAPVLPRIITPLAYLTRIGMAAEVAIEIAAQTDPVVRVLLRRVTTARYIDLDSAETSAGMVVLVAKELLTPEQVDAVLSAPVQEHERP